MANRKSVHPPLSSFGEHVVEQDRIDAAQEEIRIRVHVVLVRYSVQAVLALGSEQNLVGDRAAQRRDVLAGEIRECTKSSRIAGADAQHFTKLVVGDGDSQRRPACWRVFNPLRPTSASPRTIDWSIDVNVMFTNAESGRSRAPSARRPRRQSRPPGPGVRDRPRQSARRPRDRRPNATPASGRTRRRQPTRI